MLFNDSDYSSDSYSDKKPNPSNFVKRPFLVPHKSPIQKASPTNINSETTVKRRPIPGLSKTKNSPKVPLKQIPKPNVINSSAKKKKILMPIDSESSSYYDYESDNDELPIQRTTLPPKPFNKKVQIQSNKKANDQKNNHNLKQSNLNITRQSPPKFTPIKPRTSQPIIKNIDDEELFQDDQLSELNESSSSECRDYFEYEPDYADTNEEPDFKISEETLNLLRLIHIRSHPQAQLQSRDENVDSSNISNVSPTSAICSKEKLSFKIIINKSQFSNTTFQFFSNNHCLMSATSSNIKKLVTFKVPELFESEDIVIGTMTISNNKRQFNLSCNEKEVLSAEVTTIKKPFFYDSYFNINLKNPDTDKKDMILKTLLPKAKPGRRYTRRSIRKYNLANIDNQKIIGIKRTGGHQLKIEASSLINDDLKIFAIGVASYICSH